MRNLLQPVIISDKINLILEWEVNKKINWIQDKTTIENSLDLKQQTNLEETHPML